MIVNPYVESDVECEDSVIATRLAPRQPTSAVRPGSDDRVVGLHITALLS